MVGLVLSRGDGRDVPRADDNRQCGAVDRM